ncbi:transferase [Thauera butanivorans]|jgi:spermidine synthase|uniref:spermine/spermidine synthase domain-containing protein n=1 Tax=Thauera butanivorans TaxID=86174 RepID=UPI003AB2F873
MSGQQHDNPCVSDFGDLRSLQFDGLTVQSMMSITWPHLLALDYTRAMMGFLLFRPQPRHILMIGLGGGSLAKYCLHAMPEVRFTAVEINPEVIALRERFGIPPDDERFRVICADGVDHVRDCGDGDDGPDVLLVDGFNAAGMPERLGSAAFYADCRRALAPGGVLAINHWAGDSRYPIYASRLRQAFDGRVLSIPAEEGDNRISFAVADTAFPPSRSQILARSTALDAMHSFDIGNIAQRVLARLDRMPAHRAGSTG